MTVSEFIAKWRRNTRTECSASQEHFLDLCEVFEHPKPAEADPTGESFTFERGAPTRHCLPKQGERSVFEVISKFTKAATTSVLVMLFSLSMLIPVQSQLVGGGLRRRQGRREGRIVLPTPPFNPNAGVLGSPRGRGSNSPKVKPRRSISRRAHANQGNRRPGTPRRRRVRRGQHRH
jgi:hypothetical protein